jgi:DNA replication and repair protein RecF
VNGAGKTSLLEAVYLLATTRSFRTPRLDECCQRGRSEFLLDGDVEGAARFRLELGWGSRGRWRRLNGSVVEPARYLEALPVISWSSTDLQVIEGSPRNRRRFLDQGIVGRRPAAIEILSRYRRALEQKRELLRPGKPGRGRDLTAWNEILAAAASDLMNGRERYVCELQEELNSTLDSVGLDLPPVGLEYRPSLKVTEPTKEAVLVAFQQLHTRETEEGRPVAGPHRDELEISWNGIEISKIASAGERKIAGILLCAARGRLLEKDGRRPIVLLDDVDAELDGNRLGAAWKLFSGARQVFASSCHDAVEEHLPGARIWHLENGRITPS